MPRKLIRLVIAAILAGSPSFALDHGATYAMELGLWRLAPPVGWAGTTPGKLQFARYEGMPNGTMTINEAVVEATSAQFASGTVEFDIKPLAYSDTGIILHRHGIESGEIVYLRANPDCPAADDCIQYAPITHGLMQWDIYADEQGPAPINPTGWNHLRLVVADRKLAVYVNRAAEPSLVVARLQGDTTNGGIAFKGPAIYANLVIQPDIPAAFPAIVEPRPDPGVVTAWLAAPPTAPPVSQPPPGPWRPIAAEPTGLVNLSRAFGVGLAPSPSVAWLRTVVTEAAPARRTLRIGWAREVSVFLNGRQVFAGDNPYYPAERRLSPDGRLEPDNAVIPLDLPRGRNEIVLAVGNAWRTAAGIEKASPYGWAAEAHLDAVTSR